MRWSVTKSEDLGRVVAFLAQAPLPYVVTFTAGEEGRRIAQNRMAFEIYKQVSQRLDGHTVEDVRAICKLCVAVPILRAENDNFREKYDRIIRPLPYETKLELMVEPLDFPVTRLMTVKQMSRFVTDALAYWDRAGVSVMLPEYER
jgi:hypothetical protein